MPKAGAAKLIARDARKHKEERRVKVKAKQTKHQNQHEFLRKKRKVRKKRGNGIDNDDLFGQATASKKDLGYSLTDELYRKFQSSADYMLTIQPKLIEENSDEDSYEEFEPQKPLTQSSW